MKRSIVKTAKTKDEAINEALKEINKSINEVDIEVIEEESTGFLGLIGQKDAVVKISYDEDINEGIDSLMKEIEEDSKKELEKEFDLEDLSEKIEEENSFEDGLDEKENFDEINESFEDLIEEDFEDELEDSDQKEDEVSLYYKAKDLLEEILIQMHFEDVKVIGNLEDNIIKLDAKIDPKDTGIVIGKNGRTLDSIETVIRKIIKARSNKVKLNIDINNYKKRRDDKIVMLADKACKKVLKTRKSWNLKYMNSYERRLAHEQISKYDKLDSHSEGIEPKRYVVVDYKLD
ncbi:RNA-binding cell elongation regulator Jag/EloR [Anaerococcus vaginalis]|uniref:RNA-binding cell elongation regulator Jag/EloR n=1 Tax=Anaerococcus vaginalis TaxID=33037 RepID=UPI0029135890|nr:RNA-binding cell elongation regulator Jag/EloR [Anaerococcus vaginalis]MDU4446612.1 RNA-binding cell elongation regulator Jag/EloR [Anaerococcus vaginalis]MDU5252798.1 RNA-binding cell elongation regulator Jag/EloR [Anaerococcus vaginalis]MDU6782324.1 RNA-binding cell elongation regulator Jag/EloR [Anaerococcus vaginalis]MDU7433300.1 RNA-binding cell elongation regulator Jag/EloR [Anaerococcus vaginalis]